MKISGKLVDIHKREIYPAIIALQKGKIEEIVRVKNSEERYILPGLIDAHIHIESSMLTPAEFAIACVPHGTVGVVSDPHEIANVLGIKGVEFMIENSKRVPVRFWFGAPSCVPATIFETSGGRLGVKEVTRLIKKKEIKYLSEMMNFPGVIFNDREIMKKITAAKKLNKKIDGHAPGLSGENLEKYVRAGISTDHECSNIYEAREKISRGMKILIREGSAARNLDALKTLYCTNPEDVMLCSDDLHPEMLTKRHINKLIAKLITEGYDKFNVIRSATINPSEHYNLNAGLIQERSKADFIIVGSLEEMNVIETWINGVKVFDRGNILFQYKHGETVNIFNCSKVSASDLIVENTGKKFRIIEAFDGELLTKEIIRNPVPGETIESIQEEDILKIVVKERYKDTPPAIGFIKGFGLKEGAFASSVAHDSHNIIAVGIKDSDIIGAINEIIRLKGGLAVNTGSEIKSLRLDVAGIMSGTSCSEVAAKYELITEMVKKMGCRFSAPFMTLSFMALLVIPDLKLSDKGLFDGKRFCQVPLFVE